MKLVTREESLVSVDVVWFAVILGAATVLWWLSPPERTLGTGIRPVYVHVGLIWTGITGYVAAGLLGIQLLRTGGRTWRRWARATGWVANGFFLAGLLVSMWASQVNWGGVYLAEPRYLVNFALLLVALSVQILAELPAVPSRLLGILYVGVMLALLAANQFTPLVLHPANPIRTSNAASIQLTFLAFFALFLLAAARLVFLVARTSSTAR